jgi:RNase P/RNase MRP subunit POP5
LPQIEKEAFMRTGLVKIILPSMVKVLGEICFSKCHSLSFFGFESGLRLSRIEWRAFSGTGLVEIVLPASVEVLGENCFSE